MHHAGVASTLLGVLRRLNRLSVVQGCLLDASTLNRLVSFGPNFVGDLHLMELINGKGLIHTKLVFPPQKRIRHHARRIVLIAQLRNEALVSIIWSERLNSFFPQAVLFFQHLVI